MDIHEALIVDSENQKRMMEAQSKANQPTSRGRGRRRR